MSSLRPSTFVYSTLALLTTGAVGYAIYFDYKRRHSPDFRRALKRESKKHERAAKEAEEEESKKGKRQIREMVDAANEEGMPKDPEEKELYFMQKLNEGEGLCQDSEFARSREGDMVWCSFGSDLRWLLTVVVRDRCESERSRAGPV